MNDIPVMDCASVAEEIVSQPELMRLLEEPTRIEQQQCSVVRYNGTKVRVDEQVQLRIGGARLLGASDRAIERAFGVDHRTVSAVLGLLEARGQLPALKKRLEVWVGANAEKSAFVLSALLDRALEGEVSIELAGMLKAASQVNDFQIKSHQLLTGGATERLEIIVPGAGREAGELWLRSVLPIAVTSDVESVAQRANAGKSELHRASGHAEDTPTNESEPPPGGGSLLAAEAENSDPSTGF